LELNAEPLHPREWRLSFDHAGSIGEDKSSTPSREIHLASPGVAGVRSAPKAAEKRTRPSVR
jgi:hypothetical protein